MDCFWWNDSHLYNNVLCGEILNMIFLGIATYVTHFEETTFSMKYAKNISETTEVLGMTTKDSKVKLEKVN